MSRERLIERFRSFGPLIILFAGFIDGLNPCAFVTVVFLVSFLYFTGKSRKQIFLIGLVFSSGVFLAYLLIGLGLRGILYKLSVFSVTSEVVYILAICMVFILACYSLYDAFVYLKYGNGTNIKLKLPKMIMGKIHDIIRTSFGAKKLMFVIFLAGFLVSMLESICTGQVYLPIIMLMVKEPSMRSVSFLYLILYNLAFIIPLLTIVILVSVGVSSRRFVSISRKNTFIAKFLLAVVFFILGVLLILVG